MTKLSRYTIFLSKLFLIPCFLLLLISCGDNAVDNGPYYMRCQADGKKVEFNVQGATVGSFAQSGAQYNGVFSGYDAAAGINIQVYDNKPIEEASYSDYQIVGSALVGALISYNDGQTSYTQGGTGHDAVITIEEVTSTTVHGFFSGTVKASGKPDVVLTAGEFFVARIN